MKSLKQQLNLAEQEYAVGKNVSDNYLRRLMLDYEKKLAIPRKKLKPQVIICPVGLVGSGKTSVLKLLSSRLSLIRICNDDIRALLQKRGYNFLRTKEIAFALMNKYVLQGYSIALDGDGISPQARKPLQAYAKKQKVELILIHIKTPGKYIVDKLSYHRPDSLSHYLRPKPLHRHYLKSIKFFYSFDISKPNLKEQIQNFLLRFKRVAVK